MQQTTANGGGIPKTCQTSHGSRMTSWSPVPRQNGKEVHKRVLAIWRRSANHVRACWPQQGFGASSILLYSHKRLHGKLSDLPHLFLLLFYAQTKQNIF